MTGPSREPVRWVPRAGNAYRVAARHLEAGGTLVRSAWGVTVTRNVARTCLEPIGFEWKSGINDIGNRCVCRLVVRCRNCDGCRTQRRREWVARALRELASAEARGKRTWFVTLTISPHWRYRLTAAAKVPSSPWQKVPEDEKALDLARRAQLGDWISNYLKRVRDLSGAQFRYLAALERHVDEEFHVHVLGHEYFGEIGERDWRNAWKPTGFAQAKTVRSDAGNFRRVAAYVACYMTKQDGFPRQRASLNYGHGGPPQRPEGANPSP